MTPRRSQVVPRARAERGATAVVVAITMTVSLGFAALSLDVGHAYWEKGQLQNGADTGALSVAQACAADASSTACTSAPSLADPSNAPVSMANAAANDGQTQVTNVNLSIPDGKVQVQVAASEPNAAAGTIATWFGGVLGVPSIAVTASATARWGAPNTLVAKFPLAFSVCEIDVSATADGQLRYIQSHGVSDHAQTCNKGDSGQEIPGGFGWLKQEPDGSCSVDTAIGSPEPGDPGNDFKAGCDAVLASWKDTLVSGGNVVALLPVFNRVDSSGYTISQYAAVQIYGWHFQHPNEYLPAGTESVYPGTSPHYQNSDLGFVARFITYVFVDEDATPGPGPSPLGANVVKLTE